ncbi:class I SAM-dependent methyltransferase [bacterium SCSIO 12741]|nr:class I SAM-dependent methyltransferase [bacterium SCSIO 12741]
MKEFWNDRYGQDEYTYGKEPNVFIQETLPTLTPGKILFPADGEGRNSVFAAELGWDVSAFDYSSRGKEKADSLATSKGVKVDFTIQSFLQEEYAPEEFDAIGLTYVHFPVAIKTTMHERLDSYLKVGGYVVLEAYSKEHRELNKLNPDLGGPPDAEVMYSLEEIERDFKNYEFVTLEKRMVQLKEGFGHVGESSVIRFIGRKVAPR